MIRVSSNSERQDCRDQEETLPHVQKSLWNQTLPFRSQTLNKTICIPSLIKAVLFLFFSFLQINSFSEAEAKLWLLIKLKNNLLSFILRSSDELKLVGPPGNGLGYSHGVVNPRTNTSFSTSSSELLAFVSRLALSFSVRFENLQNLLGS